MDDYCTVTFEGDQGGTYYVACSLVEYIDDESMVNTGNSTINLYTSPQSGSNSSYIQIQSFSYPRYYSGNYYHYITDAHNISFNNKSNYYRNFDVVEITLLTLLTSLAFIRTLSRKGR